MTLAVRVLTLRSYIYASRLAIKYANSCHNDKRLRKHTYQLISGVQVNANTVEPRLSGVNGTRP